MTINPKYLIYHDLIGLNVHIRPKSKPNDSYFSDGGVVIDETKNMLTICDGVIERQVPKETVILSIRLPDGYSQTIKGRALVRRPIERVKLRGR